MLYRTETNTALASELAVGMKQNMRPKFVSIEEKIALALEHLNSAAEAFEGAENDKFANLVTKVMIDFSGSLKE